MKWTGIIIILIAAIVIIGIVSSDPIDIQDNTKEYDNTTNTVTIKDENNNTIIQATRTTPQTNYVIRSASEKKEDWSSIACYNFSDFKGDYKNIFSDMEFYDLEKSQELTSENQFTRPYEWRYRYVESTRNVSIRGKPTCKERELDNHTIEKYDCVYSNVGYRLIPNYAYTSFKELSEIKKGDLVCLFTYVKAGEQGEYIPYFADVKVEEDASWVEGLSDNLIAYYTMNGTSGDSIVPNEFDRTKYNYTLINFPPFVEGIINNSLNITDVDGEYAVMTSPDDFDLFGNFSIGFWFKALPSGVTQRILGRYAASKEANYDFFINSTGNWMAPRPVQSNGSGVDFATVWFEWDTWHYVVITSNSTSYSFYFNGSLQQTLGFYDTYIFGINSSIGRRVWSGGSTDNGFNGAVDELGFWNRTLTASEIDQLYNNGNGLPFAQLNNSNVTINSPTNITYTSSSVLFNVTVIDDSAISNCFVSIDSGVNMTTTNTSIIHWNVTNSTMTDGLHNVTFWCNDTYNHVNDTEFIWFSVDIDVPNVSIISPTGTLSNNTVNFTFSANDSDGMSVCIYNVTTSGGAAVVVNQTLTPANFTDIQSISDGDNYRVNLFCNDTNNRVNTTSGIFSIDTSVPPVTPPGGGGGGGPPIIVTGGGANWTMETQGGTGSYQLNMIAGSRRGKGLYFENNGDSSREITLTCEQPTNQPDLCDYITFEKTTFSLPLIKNIKTVIDFDIELPENVNKGDYFSNIVATDDIGNSGILTVETNVGNFNIFIEIGTKLASSKQFGDVSIPYILISFLIIGFFWPILFFIGLRKIPGGGAITSIIALVIGFGALIIF